MEPLTLTSRPRSLSNKCLKPKQKTLQNIAKYSTSPSSRRALIKNISSLLKTPSCKNSNFNSLHSFSNSKNDPKSLISVQKRHNDFLIKSSPRNSQNQKTPKPLKKKSSHPNPIIFTPYHKVSLLANPSKFLISSRRSLKVSKSQRQGLRIDSSRSQVQQITYKTRTGSINGKPKANNQDDYVAINNYANCKNQLFLSVMDGHGIYGHEVSGFVKKNLPVFIENNLPIDISKYSDTSEVAIQKIQKAIQDGFANTQKYLISKRLINLNYSGTTVISVLIRNKYCICANVGDSRAIIGRLDKNWHPIALSNDHKPNMPGEKERIENNGGRVEPFKEENGDFVGPDRVWLKNEQLPGLAMSRSIGDLVAAQVGVSFEPEIIVHEMSSEDKFLVLASDGIWEFIDNDECVRIVSVFFENGNIEGAACELMNQAVKRWEEEDSVIDDITVIVVFFDR